jgi:hypothetical protein
VISNHEYVGRFLASDLRLLRDNTSDTPALRLAMQRFGYYARRVIAKRLGKSASSLLDGPNEDLFSFVFCEFYSKLKRGKLDHVLTPQTPCQALHGFVKLTLERDAIRYNSKQDEDSKAWASPGTDISLEDFLDAQQFQAHGHTNELESAYIFQETLNTLAKAVMKQIDTFGKAHRDLLHAMFASEFLTPLTQGEDTWKSEEITTWAKWFGMNIQAVYHQRRKLQKWIQAAYLQF